MFEILIELQRAIRETLAADISAFADERSWFTLLAMMPLGIVFGAAHAMTPGHSKSLLASFVLGSGIGVRRAVTTSLLLSATHISSAMLLALVANTLITRTVVGAGRAPALELTSRVMLVGVGLWLVVRAIRNRQHMSGEGHAFGVFAGLVPCPLTLFVMVYAASKGATAAGAAFAFSMFFGVALVLSAIAAAMAWGRQRLMAWFASNGAWLRQSSQFLEIAAGSLLIVLAVTEIV